MKTEKTNDDKNLLRGVSTLDFAAKNLMQPILLLVFTIIFGGFIYAGVGHSILDSVDKDFNPQITTNSFGAKIVSAMETLPDGKILVAGRFNSYDHQQVGGLVRLNADASLDATFNNNAVPTDKDFKGILLQPDGKIILYGTEVLMRLNSDGTLDAGFNKVSVGSIFDAAIDAGGRIIIGTILPEGRKVIRINADGSTDSSFNFVKVENVFVGAVAAQNNKVIVSLADARSGVSASVVKRLNEDGSDDTTFTQMTEASSGSGRLIVQPDNKILYLNPKFLVRFNENGGIDTGFNRVNFPFQGSDTSYGDRMRLAPDGRITVVSQYGTFRRFLPNGEIDRSFNSYKHPYPTSFALQSDGGVLMGDQSYGSDGVSIPNLFGRLLPNGTLDTSFNRGGIGFQTLASNANQGFVRAIALQTDGKVLIGGKFDEVNGVFLFKIARLNSNSTVDTSFQINTSGTGNYFSRIVEFYNIRVQNDGKIIATGNFNYVLDGATKSNLVRLNSDGSIDSAFNLSVAINDASQATYTGTNKFALFNDGKLLVGTSRLNSSNNLVPVKLTASGAVDASFYPTIYNSGNIPLVSIYEVAIQPDGKVLIGGRYDTAPQTGTLTVHKSFIARLNADGSTDQTFQITEDADKLVSAFALLRNGKILVAKGSPYTTVLQSDVMLLNSDGSIDNSFNTGAGADGRINAILALSTGRIFVGGKFGNFNGQATQNLVQLNENGSIAGIYNLNEEVLGLAADGEGRVLIGGKFTVINAGGANVNRSNIARLIDSSSPAATRTRFDFDGDGRADLAVFSALSGVWSIRSSRTNQTSDTQFGQTGDKPAAADFDGDGKTDLAVYRPSEGNWYLMQSATGFRAVRWGAAEDKPVAADYDGDGKADIAVWRPSNGVWYILQNGTTPVYYQFGTAGDIPITADFDGDGKKDIAVFRPSNGTFYWLASGSNNQFRGVQFGQTGDIPAVADYNGDGKDDLAVFRPSNGAWYQYLTTPNGSYTFAATQFGQNGDEPVAADYDGDGKADVAVRRQGVWHLLMSGQGYTGVSFGVVNAQAIAALQRDVRYDDGGIYYSPK